MVEPLDQLHSAIEKLVVRNSLSRPAFKYLVDSITLFAAKLVIGQVRVVNDLGNDLHPSIANPEIILQGLESAVVTTMSETAFEHVKRHRGRWYLSFGRKGKSCLGIDVAPNQPC